MAVPQAINYKPPPTIRDFILDHRPGELFYDWIIGPVGCTPADTEYLTPQGWKRMDAWEPGDVAMVCDADGGDARFEAVEHVRLPALSAFHTFDSGSLVMELSSEHKVPYRDYRGHAAITTAGEMASAPSRRQIPTTMQLRGDPTHGLSADAVRLRVAFAADGHIPPAGHKVVMALRKDRKKVRLRSLLERLEIVYSETTYPQRPTETIFRFEWEYAAKDLDFVYAQQADILDVVVDECLHWDGLHDHVEKRFYTSDKAQADAIQYAAHATGRRAAIRVGCDPRNDAWRTMYTVQIRDTTSSKNVAYVREHTQIGVRDSDDGWKYCLTTSTGFFLARCRDTVFVTGNSGKTTGIFFKLIYMSGLQKPGPDGIRRSRAVVVRNTLPQLRDTTLVSWNYWFRDGQAGKWYATDNRFILKFADVECEVLFRPLDTPADIARVLSLEVTFALLDEFVQIPREVVDALSARLGRYPSAKDGGATNWGMWGSSNPDTEDNWWYDMLHYNLPENATYFVQPSGFSDDAENVENLPGKRDYYVNQAKGKSEQWVKQFLDAEWGYSAAGKPVVATFNGDFHVAKSHMIPDPHQPMIAGFDPGIGGSAFIFGQEDLHGRLRVFGELVQDQMGADRLMRERVMPYMRQRFPQTKLIIAPDPAAGNRSSNDEKTIVDTLRKYAEVRIETNNRLPRRLNAIEHYTTRITDVGPALMIDPKHCPILIRALKGGWRYEVDQKRGRIKNIEPEKNAYSHPGDGFGYLARYFHADFEKQARRGPVRGLRQASPRATATQSYHVR